MVKKVDERKKRILKAIIHEHILTAEPVGSRTLAKTYKLGISSATIRNEMSDLEELGLIEQPYTSAGRIPSDKGYRFYVDSLMRGEEAFPQEFDLKIQVEQILKDLHYKNGIQNIMSHLARMLSRITQHTSIVSEPLAPNVRIKHIQLTPVDSQSYLLLLITDTGLVHNKIIKLNGPLNNRQINYLNNFFNDKLCHRDLESITPDYLEKLSAELLGKVDIPGDILDSIHKGIIVLSSPNDFKIYLGGTSYILDQPEFNDRDSLKKVMKILEEEEILKDLFVKIPEQDLVVLIGQENIIKDMQKCSVVIATYFVDNSAIGRIGVIGPTRMEYPRVLASVNTMSRLISKIISELSG